jgi:predicted permease
MLIFSVILDKEAAVQLRSAMMASLLMTVPRDMRYGLRRLNQHVGFTAVAVACLALGICASVTVFSVFNALVLQPIPSVVEQDRLVSLVPKPMLMEGMGEEPVSRALSYPDFLRYRERSRAFSSLVAYRGVAINLVLGGEPLRVNGQVVSEGYFTALGLQPAEGRLFAAGEKGREAELEVVVSHALWQRILASGRGLGNALTLNGHPFVVIGVAPPAFRGTQYEHDLDVWMPLETAPLVASQFSPSDLQDPERGWLLTFFGRLAPGVDVEDAQREMNLLAGRLAVGRARDKGPSPLELAPGLRIRPGARKALASRLALLTGVVGLLMLVVCANLGSLLLVKAAARQEEIGVRLALGVTRGQLVRQLLAESVTLSLVGGAVGFILSLWTVEALQGLSLGQYLPRMRELSVDSRVVAFTLLISLGTGILFGLVPALWSTRRQVVPLLHGNGDRRGLDRGRTRLQELFVVAQVTISLMLLVATGLFVRTLWNLQSIDPGFDSSNVLNLRLNLPRQTYSQASGIRFYEELLLQVRKVQGVRAAALVSWVPLSNSNDFGRLTRVRPQSGGRRGPPAEEGISFSAVSPGYFRCLGIPLLRGRDFSPADRQSSNPVVIVNDTLGSMLWPGRDPIGERLEVMQDAYKSEIREVVGVVRSVRLESLQENPQPFFYLPFAQLYEPSMALQVRTMGDSPQVVGDVGEVVRKLGPGLSIKVTHLDHEVGEILAQPRLLSWLLGSFSLTALLVTALGLYGTLAYSVSSRTRELGIRMALGGRSFEIVAMVLRRGLTLTLTGLVFGLFAATWTTSFFKSFLFGVTPTDPAVFLAVALLLTLVGLAASSLPAYSAIRIDPMAIIRHE